jgi:glycosyltransferase involved in cell wall biosynthesis
MLADSHGLYDDRIYWKEAVSLKNGGYEVHFVLAGESDEQGVTEEGIAYTVIQRDRFAGNRLLNYLAKRLPGGLYARMFREAAQLRTDVYHIHDLKVNRIGKKLKGLGHQPKLVYDVHEPYPENILDYWPDRGVKGMLKRPWAGRIRRWEKKTTAGYDLIITTEENMQERFKAYFPEKPVAIIYNYTDLPGQKPGKPDENKEYDAIYTGGITEFRGAWQILEAIRIAKHRKPRLKVLFLGSWFPPGLKERMQRFIRESGIGDQVVLKEAVPYREVSDHYRNSRVGLGIFLPIQTHRIILQIKIFEYMNFGLPILGSNFGHIARIIEEHRCGLTVDPLNPQEIADRLLELLSDNDAYEKMSRNGTEAASQHYQWERMEEKLAALYGELIKKQA